MEAQISLLVFPQGIENNRLSLNILAIPRNFNPLIANPLLAPFPAWVEANLSFDVKILTPLEDYPRLDLVPQIHETFLIKDFGIEAKTIFETLEIQFDISDNKTAEKPESNHFAKKYLPNSYRNAFNFTKPRTRHAVIDDSYACALKEAEKPIENFKESTNAVSWGKVFAYCLRQPAIAKKCGFLHEISIEIPEGGLINGGWVFADFTDGTSYHFADKTIVKRYAARLPKIQVNENRVLFAPVLFPVRHDDVTLPPDNPAVPSTFDQLLIEASIYDDGFSKIVHTEQPVSDHLLKEERDSNFPVTNDAGIRLGWDDEQLLIWMNRQLEEDPTSPGQRVDAPMGIMGYRIDVREKSPDPDNPNAWTSLCKVSNKAELMLGEVSIDAIGEARELTVEVYPSVPDGDLSDKTKHFWLPSFFAYWIGNSLVLQDENAIDLYRKDQNLTEKNSIPQQAKKNAMYQPEDIGLVPLQYGKNYEFRVRMADLSGGGPSTKDSRKYDAEAPEASWLFRRHAIPQALKILNSLPQSDDKYFSEESLSIRRPRISYPSALFTGYPEALNLLKADFEEVINKFQQDYTDPDGNRPIGIFDPDVDQIEIEVAVRALDMDTSIKKHDPQDNYAIFYTTTRKFPDAIDGILDLPISFVDSPIIQFNGSKNLFMLGLSTNQDSIDDITELILPSNRDIQITVRAKCAEKINYYVDDQPLLGMTTKFLMRQSAQNETALFKTTSEQAMVRGIFLREPLPKESKEITIQDIALHGELASFKKTLLREKNNNVIQPESVENLSKIIGCKARGMSLTGDQGQRWQFGAARAIRHSLAPDNTSLTFATENDLLNHWLVPITLIINRDWSWDGILPESIHIFRRTKFLLDEAWQDEVSVGTIELKKGINIHALTNSDRLQTYICFIDSVEPKTSDLTKFPDEILIEYKIQPNFKIDNPELAIDEPLQLSLHLPITTPPAQQPKIVSAGMALSPYQRDAEYANTEVRQRYLWVEFDQPIQNPRDTYFGRITAYAPDPLLAEWKSDWMTPKEPVPLAIEPEFIRVISPQHSDDKSGLNAMQQLIQATDSKRHYLIPLPPGLNSESPELFGFFTYEIRVGHLEGWSTAQGRFGRALEYQGVQHPLPQLMCLPDRSEKQIRVAAPYAEAVFDGRNITSKPVRTQIWALLYTQVRMADKSDNRNILLNDRLLQPEPENIFDPATGVLLHSKTFSDGVKKGIATWTNTEISNILKNFGLPADSPLSVLCVEIMPNGEQFMMNDLTTRHGTLGKAVENNFSLFSPNKATLFLDRLGYNLQKSQLKVNIHDESISARPLTNDLGHYRILRTSTLTAVPEVCCVDC